LARDPIRIVGSPQEGDAMPSAYESFRNSNPADLAAPIGPKVSTSVVLIAAGLAAFAAPALTMTLPSGLQSYLTAPPPAPVRIVDAAKPQGIPCTQQTWPYIDAHCLKQGSDKIATISAAPESPVREAPKAEPKTESRTEVAKLDAAPQTAPAAVTSSDATAALARVPLPLPRPVAADEDDEYLPPPAERRQARQQRRHYGYSDPRDRVVRELNRVIPFGILRF
jgi:hypothetical protein